MEIWQIWLIIALSLVIIEIFTVGFATLCLSIGALGAAVISFFNNSLMLQISVFSLLTLISFIFIRPFMLKFLTNKKDVPKSGIAALIGRKVIVVEDIVPDKNSGLIAIDGDRWKAVSEDGSIITKGEKVVVLSIDSIILTVRKI